MSRRINIALITLGLLIGLALRGEGRKVEATGEPLEAARETKTSTAAADDRRASGSRLAGAAALPGLNQGQRPNLPDLNALIQKIAGRKMPNQVLTDRNLIPGVLSGIRSFIYGYPLVMMGITQRLTTNVSAPNQSGRAPKNQSSHATVLPDASCVDVQLPNVNSLYSLAGPFSFRLHNKTLIDETC